MTVKKLMPETSKTLEEAEVGIMIKEEGKKPTIFREAYPIQEPYIYAAIVKNPETQKTFYEVIDPTPQKQ
jgi:hypothetical protein